MAHKKKDQTTEEQATTTGLPATSTHGAGMESLGPEDFIIPRLNLVQPTSQIEGVEAGKFSMNLTLEEFDELQAVFLKVTKGRVFFADPNDPKPVCGSADRLKPSPRYEQPVAPTCKECPSSRWHGKEPPPCHENYHLLGVTEDEQLPFWWSVKSTGIAPTKRFLSAVALRARAGKNLFDARVRITSQLVTLPGKKYYVPVYTVTWLRDSSVYRDLYEQYAEEEIERTFQAEDIDNTESVDPHGFDWEQGEQGR